MDILSQIVSDLSKQQALKSQYSQKTELQNNFSNVKIVGGCPTTFNQFINNKPKQVVWVNYLGEH